MPETQLLTSLVRRYALAHTPWGRGWLNLCFRGRRLLWRWRLRAPAMAKRALDVGVSAGLLVLLGPLLLAAAALVKLEDGGPVFFVQTRVGKHGRRFSMLKFRSMCPNAEARLREVLVHNQHSQGVTFKLKNDPRITRVGRWLRRFSVDELPQLFNVLTGDMSLVGPRPPLPREVARYSLADRRRLAAVPGLTCFWQISGRSEIDFSGQVELDVRYIENQHLALDLKILAKTLPAVLAGTGAC